MTAAALPSQDRPAPVSGAFLVRATMLAFALWLASAFAAFVLEGDVAIGERGVLGGDFLAFYAASLGVQAGDALAMYDIPAFEAQLRTIVDLPVYGLWWQYPPPVFTLITPLAYLPYPVAFILWIGGTLALFAGALRTTGLPTRFVLFGACSPLALIVINQGQIAFLTAALLVVAASCAKSRPVLAGICAGLLVIKPQLGVLLPVAYAAAGCWRAFGVATLTAMAAVLLSTLMFSFDVWAQFFDAVARLNADISGPRTVAPLAGMATPMATLMSWGAPAALARGLHILIAVGLAGFVGWVWRRRGVDDLAAAALCAASVLVTPYAYAYELIALAFPCVVLARHALAERWLVGEREALAVGWLAAMTYGFWAHAEGWPVAFAIAAVGFALIARRAAAR